MYIYLHIYICVYAYIYIYTYPIPLHICCTVYSMHYAFPSAMKPWFLDVVGKIKGMGLDMVRSIRNQHQSAGAITTALPPGIWTFCPHSWRSSS